MFAAFHAGTSYQYLKEFEIGEIDLDNSSSALRPTEKQVRETPHAACEPGPFRRGNADTLQTLRAAGADAV